VSKVRRKPVGVQAHLVRGLADGRGEHRLLAEDGHVRLVRDGEQPKQVRPHARQVDALLDDHEPSLRWWRSALVSGASARARSGFTRSTFCTIEAPSWAASATNAAMTSGRAPASTTDVRAMAESMACATGSTMRT